ncbi:MAG: FAD-binding protein, partial [Clostridiaceae bacterium]|nr:FAD-binding protein [Clostridiaceae bacterium]
IDMSKDFIPVAPSQHYSMGGIKTDEWGKTKIKGFYAVGEAACNGIHGANRLASNSLLEGLVFGRRIGRQIAENFEEIKKNTGIVPKVSHERKWTKKIKDSEGLKRRLQTLMNDKVGIIRSKESLYSAMEEISLMQEELNGAEVTDISSMELKNMISLAGMVVKAALLREESRGAHFRQDYPAPNNEIWLKNIVFGG